ncbi:MBL fold metallo-hydrolase [Bacillus sp. N1-1]|jgi:L-ascorbate metabolism protein UlaG (beta-lactamase superfamily)|uniref:MBL fold metallo-hydrolase n=1 Tax=Bacillus sp. N1-1 TaxID=2682541 RepID=UPI0013180353|nr:MBL fold metallo-hydrolase [Bacillus sp. N1-1]QHA90823.1 MBL fold metallo-hydrolase [Bacillus sp. N1-1]
MNIQLIRNATLVLHYADKKFLIDPFLSDQGAMPPFPNTANQHLSNPTVGISTSINEIINVDAVIVTHLHPDHFDDKAIEVLPKEIAIFAQNKEDVEVIKGEGFQNVFSLEEESSFENVTLSRTDGKHGAGEILKQTGKVSGIAFSHPNEKTLYVAGDTLFNEDVRTAIQKHKPEIIVVNAGAAQFLEGGPITMTKENVVQTYQEAPDATIVAVHMESLNHCLLTRDELKQFIEEKDLLNKVLIPDDGQTLSF